MAEPQRYDPDIIGAGGARKAAGDLRKRQNKVDAAIAEATGDIDPTTAQKKSAQEPNDPKMSSELMRRISRMLRGKSAQDQ